jgi:hypothetical protein
MAVLSRQMAPGHGGVRRSCSGGGRESNPPTGVSRRTGFEDREGHQSPFASLCGRRIVRTRGPRTDRSTA